MNQETIPTLEQQLSELENLYAEYLMENMNVKLLKAIHYKITHLQSQLNELRKCC